MQGIFSFFRSGNLERHLLSPIDETNYGQDDVHQHQQRVGIELHFVVVVNTERIADRPIEPILQDLFAHQPRCNNCERGYECFHP
mgnify:CR=1 FL=1